ncbi:MAG TPA: methyltransferase domain-containing protein [Anaerolineales bacterium]|nr:methyltransferase domain-containing protein [Anaerolineales bacterium]
MKPETVSLLCRPGTHEPLRLASEAGPDGSTEEVLVGVHSGERFRVRDGIPLLLDPSGVSGFNQRYQRLYNRVAGLYDSAIRLVANMAGGGEGNFRREYLRELEVRDGDRVLEVSVGTGANLHYLPVRAACFGLDLSWGMLKRCQGNLRQWGLEAELILGNAEELPLVDESFDAVFHVGGINAFNDRGRAITEMVRVARAGTKILIVDETARMMEALTWIPGFRRWMEKFGDRFSAPTGLVPAEMKDIRVRQIAKGNLYCLTFRKP